MDKILSKLLQVILEYKKIFLGGGGAYTSLLHTICVTALSVVFDLQVDVPKLIFFSLPWFLVE